MNIQVQIYICSRDRIEDAEKTILSQGKQFADKYGFRIPHKIIRTANAQAMFCGFGTVFFCFSQR